MLRWVELMATIVVKRVPFNDKRGATVPKGELHG
jgi:hypothetical protein